MPKPVPKGSSPRKGKERVPNLSAVEVRDRKYLAINCNSWVFAHS